MSSDHLSYFGEVLQLEWSGGHAEYLTDAGVPEELSQHGLFFPWVEVCFVDEHLTESQFLELCSDGFDGADGGEGDMVYLVFAEGGRVDTRRRQVAAEEAVFREVLLEQLLGGLDDQDRVGTGCGHLRRDDGFACSRRQDQERRNGILFMKIPNGLLYGCYLVWA